jgi:DNA-binding transcriptional ArsR family regulator
MNFTDSGRPLDDVLEPMADRFRLLADPTRLAILRTLMREGEQSVGALVAATGRGQANVSKHLKQLATAGLLARRKDGLQVFYRLADPVVEQLCRLVCEAVQRERWRNGTSLPPAVAPAGGPP